MFTPECINATPGSTQMSRWKNVTTSLHGFRKHWSCETQLYCTIDDFVKPLKKRNRIDYIVLDFSNALDKFHRGRLLSKLQHCGVNGILHKWVKSWLQDWEQRVVIDAVEPEKYMIGVPQGNIICPFYFIIYVNDIVYDWIATSDFLLMMLLTTELSTQRMITICYNKICMRCAHGMTVEAWNSTLTYAIPCA